MTGTSESPTTVFEVLRDGLLLMADYDEPETREEFDDYVPDYWSGSPKELADAIEECPPLGGVVLSVYYDFRAEVVDELQKMEADASKEQDRLKALKEQLAALPEEPEDCAVDWLLSLGPKEFDERIVPEVDKWLGEPPDWRWEGDYLPQSGTAQGAAIQFFQCMRSDDLETLGVEVIEGEHPGSTYFAAELKRDISAANRAAELAGIPVRFVAATN